MATLHIIEAGHCTQFACMAVRGSGWKAHRFPARAYLIENAHGRWLFDTGYAPHFRQQARGILGLYPRVTPVDFHPHQSAEMQLAERGIQPADLSAIIISHFHADHIAGLRDFPDLPLFCSRGGWEKLRGMRGVSALLRAFVPGLIPDDFEQRARWLEALPEAALPDVLHPFQRARELPGSGGDIWLLDLPGHAAGHIGAFVRTSEGWVLLAADAAWSPENFEQARRPSPLTYLLLDDRAAFFRTLESLRQLDAAGKVSIWLSHEPANRIRRDER